MCVIYYISICAAACGRTKSSIWCLDRYRGRCTCCSCCTCLWRRGCWSRLGFSGTW